MMGRYLVTTLVSFLVLCQNAAGFNIRASCLAKGSPVKSKTRWAIQPRSIVRRRLADDDEFAAAQIEEEEKKAAEAQQAQGEVAVKSVDMITGASPQWVDNAAGANIQWWQLSWWGYLLLLYPVMLFADDSLHFLPPDGLAGIFKSLTGFMGKG
jgi:hypothetical protein